MQIKKYVKYREKHKQLITDKASTAIYQHLLKYEEIKGKKYLFWNGSSHAPIFMVTVVDRRNSIPAGNLPLYIRS